MCVFFFPRASAVSSAIHSRHWFSLSANDPAKASRARLARSRSFAPLSSRISATCLLYREGVAATSCSSFMIRSIVDSSGMSSSASESEDALMSSESSESESSSSSPSEATARAGASSIGASSAGSAPRARFGGMPAGARSGARASGVAGARDLERRCTIFHRSGSPWGVFPECSVHQKKPKTRVETPSAATTLDALGYTRDDAHVVY
jgi:hypothetical protein